MKKINLDKPRLKKVKKLADALAKLGADLIAGKGPALESMATFDVDGPVCAFGHALYKAGVVPKDKYESMSTKNNEAFLQILDLAETCLLPESIGEAVNQIAGTNDSELRKRDLVGHTRTFSSVYPKTAGDRLAAKRGPGKYFTYPTKDAFNAEMKKAKLKIGKQCVSVGKKINAWYKRGAPVECHADEAQ